MSRQASIDASTRTSGRMLIGHDTRPLPGAGILNDHAI